MRLLMQMAVLAGFMCVGIWLAGQPSPEIHLNNLFAAPSMAHLFGTDELGRDVLLRLLQGIITSLTVAGGVVLMAAAIGVPLGLLSGYYKGWPDILLQRVSDIVLSFPGILLAIAIAALLKPGIENIIFALGLLGWVGFYRLARVETQAIAAHDFVHAAKLEGRSLPGILRQHILPNIASPLFVEAVFVMAGAILAEAGLSFLGVGLALETPSLGTMLREGVRTMVVAPHLVIFPGLALMFLTFLFNMVGDAWRDRLDKRSQN